MEFQIPFTDTSFASVLQELIVPERLAAPNYSIDYISETTVESVAFYMEYSTNEDWTDPVVGINCVFLRFRTPNPGLTGHSVLT